MLDIADRIRGLLDAAVRGDFAAWRWSLHEGVEWHMADATYFGPEAVLKGLADRIQHFEDFAIDIRRIISAGDTVVVEARYRAIAKATGKVLNADVAHVFDVRDRKIVRVQQYSDSCPFAGAIATASTSALAELVSNPDASR